jgi:hypothetical protein
MNDDRITFADAFDKREIAQLFDTVKMWAVQKRQREANERKKQLGKPNMNNGSQNGNVHRP